MAYLGQSPRRHSSLQAALAGTQRRRRRAPGFGTPQGAFVHPTAAAAAAQGGYNPSKRNTFSLAGGPATAPGAASGAPNAAGSPFDYSADPILQQIRAAGQQQIASQEAATLAGQRRLLTDYGDPDLARSILGAGDPAGQAAGQNPFSVRTNMKRSYDQGVGSLEEGLNKSNLFYSSTRGKELGNAATAYQGQQAGAARQVQDMLSELAAALVATRTGVSSEIAQAQAEAAQRAQEFALQYGIDPAAGGATVTPGAPGTAAPASSGGKGGPGKAGVGKHLPARSAQLRKWRNQGKSWEQIRALTGSQNLEAWLSGTGPRR